MQNEKLETLKEYRDYDPSFMKIYREYKIDTTTEDSKEEVLNALVEWLDDAGFIQPYHEEMEAMEESAPMSSHSI